jgi:hypothetical protein
MKFEYEAVSIHGGRQKFKGVIEAPSGELAIMDLMKRKLYPISLRSMNQNDVTVANRLANFKRIKNSLTPGMNIAVRTPGSSAAPRFRISWGMVGWVAGILALLWAIAHIH